jgi:hypothetical protein
MPETHCLKPDKPMGLICVLLVSGAWLVGNHCSRWWLPIFQNAGEPSPKCTMMTAIINDDPARVRQAWSNRENDPTQQRRYDLVAIAVTLHAPHALKQLLDLDADAGRVNDDGYTPLMLAVQLQDIELVQTLLDARADPAWTSPQGHSAILEAAQTGNAAIIGMLGHHIG